MNYKQISNLSCYEEFEIQCDLLGISKIDVLKEIGHKIYNYYFFISNDGIFNWYDLEGNHVEDPGILNEIKEGHIPRNIIKCVIPDSVTNIDKYAFYDCKSLKSIIIPNSVTYIGDGAFSYCVLLTSITLSNSIKSIGYWAFYYCESLKEIIIPDSISSIDCCVFSHYKSLISITIPNSVMNINKYAFYGCVSLKDVIFKGKTLDEVKKMNNYPFGIEDESIIKCEK